MNYKFIPYSIEIDYNIQKVPANIAHATIVPLKNPFTVCLFNSTDAQNSARYNSRQISVT